MPWKSGSHALSNCYPLPTPVYLALAASPTSLGPRPLHIPPETPINTNGAPTRHSIDTDPSPSMPDWMPSPGSEARWSVPVSSNLASLPNTDATNWPFLNCEEFHSRGMGLALTQEVSGGGCCATKVVPGGVARARGVDAVGQCVSAVRMYDVILILSALVDVHTMAW